MSWNWFFVFALVEWTIRIVMIAVILRRRFNPSTAMAWLVLILFLPWLGLVVYLLVGVNHLGRRRARSHSRAVAQARQRQGSEPFARHETRPLIEPQQRNMILQAERISGNPIVAGNDAELIPDADTLCDKLVTDIDAARHHVHLLYYIFRPARATPRVGNGSHGKTEFKSSTPIRCCNTPSL